MWAEVINITLTHKTPLVQSSILSLLIRYKDPAEDPTVLGESEPTMREA